jgi:hypothetical protein
LRSSQQHGADRHLAPGGGRFRFFERECYGFVVIHAEIRFGQD